MYLDDWQSAFLHDALGERADGRWAAFEVGLVVPRQNGKGSILEARELAGLFLFDEQLILHSAHEFKTAAEAFRRLHNLIDNTPELKNRVLKVRTSHGDEGIELKTGQRIRFVARSTGSGRGFTGDTIILDEAYNLPGSAMAALLPTMAARSIDGNPQLWYTSSAPLPRAESDTLRRLCRRGREGADRLAYVEYCAPNDAVLDDPDQWHAANPGLGIRIDPEFITSEMAAMDPEDFARERLGIWREDEHERLISAHDWDACTNPDQQLVDPVTFAVDVTPDRSAAAIGAASGMCVEVVDHRKGTGWVVDRVAELVAKHRCTGVVVDPGSQAGSFIDRLEAAGVTVQIASTRDHSQACGAFYEAVVEHQLSHLPDPALEAAVAGAVKRETKDAWLWNRRGGADISPLVAVTLALWGAARQPEMAVPEVVVL